jgi:hypothetical protein
MRHTFSDGCLNHNLTTIYLGTLRALIPYTNRFSGDPGPASKVNPVLDSYYVLLESIMLLNEDKKRISSSFQRVL